MQKIIDVNMGQIKIVKNGEILRAILGSCVGIGFIFPSRKICGLAHCLLPAAPSATFSLGGRFVDQSIQSLIILMKITDQDKNNVQIIIAGGGNMLSSKNHHIGLDNFEQAVSLIKKWGFKKVEKSFGLNSGTRISINSLKYDYAIDKIPRLADST